MPYKDPERQKQSLHEYYLKNKDQFYKKSRQVTDDKRRFVTDFKSNKPCADCGVVYPFYVMDLDHRNPEEKVQNISQLVSRASWTKLIEEIEKCDVVCANCHRERTQRQIEARHI